MKSSIDLTPEEIEIRMKYDKLRKRYNETVGTLVFVKCVVCKGSGLSASAGSSIWVDNTYCGKCKGFGGEYISKELAIECDMCKSLKDKKECKKCGGSGYVDWIENIVGKRLDNE